VNIEAIEEIIAEAWLDGAVGGSRLVRDYLLEAQKTDQEPTQSEVSDRLLAAKAKRFKIFQEKLRQALDSPQGMR
jgi:hypothetical protein